MKKSSKTKVKVLVLALALLLCLALSIGVAGAWYQANRTATGTLNMDTGIKIEYTGFHQEVADSDTIWQKDDVEFNLFSTTSVVPGTEIILEPNTTINAATGSVDFYARFKLDYKFYTDLDGTAEATGINPTDVLVPSADFINSAWVESGDGFYYLASGTTLDVLTPGGTPAAFFADGAKYTINTNIGGEGFGYQVDADTTIVRADVILTLEVAQVGTSWSVTPLPVVEDLSTNVLQDTSGNAVTGDVVAGTTYQIVDAEQNGIKYQFAVESASTLGTSALTSGVSNLSSVVVNPNDVDGTATVKGYTGSPTDVVIPDYIVVNGKTYQVTEIGEDCFINCNSIKNIKIPSSVAKIGNNAFMHSSVSNVAIANGAESIGHNAFFSSMITEILIPDSVSSIGVGVFQECSQLTNASIGSGIVQLQDSCFEGCGLLSSVSVGNAVARIGNWAFANCYSLTSINLPSNLVFLGENVFANCGLKGNFKVPDSVSNIGRFAFQNCTELISITIGKNVETIGSGAFSGCLNLNKFVADGIYKTFDSGKVLAKGSELSIVLYDGQEEYTIPDGITGIGEYAFENFNNLTSLIIPDEVCYIGKYAFSGCINISEIILPEELTTISEGMFYNCSNLSHITIKDKVKTIDYQAFDSCTSLNNVILPRSLVSIGEYAFRGCSSLTNLEIKDGLQSIGYWAFERCGLISVEIPDSVVSLGENAFNSCDSLSEVVIGNGLVNISNETFYGCTNLKSLTLGNALKVVGAFALYSCSQLITITINATSLPEIQYNALPQNLTTVYVPAEAVEAYKADATWGTYNIQPIA